MIDKATNGITCGDVDVTVEQLNQTANAFVANAQSPVYDVNVTSNSFIQQQACRAEIQSQKLISTISGYMAPFGDS